jgi:uncharacterized glyoxalase superfamily protein PhnB
MRFGATVLYVNDVAAAIDFYRRAFGRALHSYDETLGFAEFDTGGSVLALASHAVGELLMPGAYSRPEGGRPAGVEIGFLTDDVPGAFAKLIAAGATPIAAPRRMPWGLEVAYGRLCAGAGRNDSRVIGTTGQLALLYVSDRTVPSSSRPLGRGRRKSAETSLGAADTSVRATSFVRQALQ